MLKAGAVFNMKHLFSLAVYWGKLTYNFWDHSHFPLNKVAATFNSIAQFFLFSNFLIYLFYFFCEK